MAVVHFREVIEGAGLLGVREHVLAAVVLDGDVALFDIDVRRAVFAHGAEFDQMAIGLIFAESEEQIERADDIVDLGEDGVLAVDHRVGSRALLGKMNDRLGLEFLDHGGEEFVVGHIARRMIRWCCR